MKQKMLSFLFSGLLFLSFAPHAFAADAKITELTADTAPTTDDLLITVDDPGGTPVNKKVTMQNAGKGIVGAAITNTESQGKIPIGQGDGTATWADPLVQGLTAHDASGTTTNPVAIGGYSSTAAPTAVSADDEIVRAWFKRDGAQVIDFRHLTGNAAGATDSGVPPLAVRDDALSALSDAEGDYVPIRVDANGAIWTTLATALSSTVDSITTAGNTGANGNAKINCTDNAFLNMTTATTTEIVALSGTTVIYVCSFSIVSEGDVATTVTFVSGTGANCVTSQAARSSGMILGAGSTVGIARGSGEGMILKSDAGGDALCVTQTGAANIGVDISYTRF